MASNDWEVHIIQSYANAFRDPGPACLPSKGLDGLVLSLFRDLYFSYSPFGLVLFTCTLETHGRPK